MRVHASNRPLARDSMCIHHVACYISSPGLQDNLLYSKPVWAMRHSKVGRPECQCKEAAGVSRDQCHGTRAREVERRL